MSRIIKDAANRLVKADDEELYLIVSHDPDMIRDVAKALLIPDEVLAQARSIAAQKDSISYPSGMAANYVRSVLRKLLAAWDDAR